MSRGVPLTALEIARMIAKDHGLFIVDVTEKKGTAYVVYRRSTVPGGKGIRLGRRADPGALLHFVRKLTA
jgi:hypothetical protein